MNATTTSPSGHQIVVREGRKRLVITPGAIGEDFTEDEAQLITKEIQRTSVKLWVLVTEAHDRKAHVAMGYPSWDDYVRAELEMSPSRSYQMLDTGHVMREVAAAGANIEEVPVPPTRVVSRIKARLDDVRNAVAEGLEKDVEPDEVLRALAREPREPTAAAPAASEGGGGGGPEAEEPTGRGTGLVTCPACDGSGKTTRQMAPKLRAFLRRERPPQADK